MGVIQSQQSLISYGVDSFDSDEYDWVKKLDPEKRVLKGKAYHFTKRALDLIITLISAPFWLPVFLLVALIIKVTSPGGPVLFTQMRTGYNGRRFRIYKFRTMVPDAEALKAKYMHLNELQWPDFKITNDPRVLPIGKLLRKTSLDELPQILNIIKGEMSYVGPRPTSFGPETYKLWHTERLDVIPGLTGLWQIYGRASTEFDQRLRLDIVYIKYRSIWLDLQILIRTVTAVIKQHGAY